MNRLKEREAQALEVQGKDRDGLDEEHPIIYAESAPCRFQSVTFWFKEEDGVEIVQDLDHEEEDLKVYYLGEEERVELTDGALYEWAIDRFNNA